MGVSQLGIKFITDGIIDEVKNTLKADFIAKNLDNIPNCTVFGYNLDLLKNPAIPALLKEPVIKLYDFYYDPDVSDLIKADTDTTTASVISSGRQTNMKTLVNGDKVELSEKDQKTIDLCVRKTLEYLLSNLASHIHVTVIKDEVTSAYTAAVSVDPVGLI